MLMQNFKPAADLGISNAERGALAKTLVLLETDKMKLVHRDEDFDGEVKFGFSGQFNMNNWELSSPCGSVCCIGGTAELVGGLVPRSLERTADNNQHLYLLFYPEGLPYSIWPNITPTQAARALRSYLTTGDAKWTEAVSVAE